VSSVTNKQTHENNSGSVERCAVLSYQIILVSLESRCDADTLVILTTLAEGRAGPQDDAKNVQL
jgi:hypothetical protein